MANKIQFRRDTAAAWTAANPILAAGELAVETDTKRKKVGDGTTAWTALAYEPDSTTLANSFAPVVSSRFKRVKTRNAAVPRPHLRQISTRIARVKPLITMTNITTSILNQTNTTLTASSPEFNYWGSVAWQVTSSGFCSYDPHSASYNPPWVAEFVTDSPLFALEMTGGAQNVEVQVNGERIYGPQAPSGGSWMLIDWNGVRAMRRYTFRGQGGMALKTIRRNAVDSLFAPKKDNDVVCAWITDSYGQTISSDGIATLPMLTCDMLGWKIATSTEGGSGYDQPAAPTTIANFKARVPDVIAANPDIVVLAGGHNIRDTTTEAQAVLDVINALKAGLPGVPILVFGAFYGSIPGESGYTVENALLANAATQTGATFLSTSGWINGTGRNGNRVVADGVTNSTTTITSATAAFVSGDVGSYITGSGIPANTTIASVTNGTTAVLSAAATATATGVSLTITNQKGDGNADILIDSGGVHPQPGLGGDFFAARCADAITGSAAI